jgi:5-formyltetrahydrofolate cyclo-ligase
MSQSFIRPHAGKITPMESAKKENLRETLRSHRPHSSQGLTENLIRLTLELNAETIACYWPLPSEPDTTDFNNWVGLLGKTLLTPRIVGDTLEFASGPASKGTLGILEPSGPAVNLNTAELILVPAMAVDNLGNRLGKGRGYYDRALFGSSVPRFAVIFDEEFLELVPTEDHDLRMNGSVSPSAIRYLNN